MEFLLAGTLCIVFVLLRFIDAAIHRKMPRSIQIVAILSSIWAISSLLLRMFDLGADAFAHGLDSPRESTFKLLREGDQRFFLFGCVGILIGSIAILLKQFPTTERWVDGVFKTIVELRTVVEDLRDRLKRTELEKNSAIQSAKISNETLALERKKWQDDKTTSIAQATKLHDENRRLISEIKSLSDKLEEAKAALEKERLHSNENPDIDENKSNEQL